MLPMHVNPLCVLVRHKDSLVIILGGFFFGGGGSSNLKYKIEFISICLEDYTCTCISFKIYKIINGISRALM